MKIRASRIISAALVLLLAASVLTACEFHGGIRLGSSYSSSKKHMSSSFEKLSGKDTKEIKLKEGTALAVTYDIKVESGELRITLISPEGSEVIAFENEQKGKKQIKIEQGGTYKIVVEGKAAKGSYDFRWEAQ